MDNDDSSEQGAVHSDRAEKQQHPDDKEVTNDEDSEVEYDGMDVDEDDEEKPNSNDLDSAQNQIDADADDNDIEALADEEAKDLEEARLERMELMASEQRKMSTQDKGNSSSNMQAMNASTPQERLEYLIAQSEAFAHFLAGSVATTADKKGKKGGSRGKKGRLTEAEEDAQLLKSAQSKRKFVRLEQQPSNLSPECKMHAYQLEGLNWMLRLHDNGINGILADEMGLGKTLQTISLLAYLRESRGVRGPHIVIVPKSVVGNWIREIKKWCPCLRAIRMGGTKEERAVVVSEHLPVDPITGKHKFDVLVTSYEGFLKEKGKLCKIPWNYLIIDEAHRIKNEKSSLSVAVRHIKTQFRLLITGTPLQNNLRELWALLNFLMPDIFGDAEQFDEWFSLSDETGKENVIKKLHTVLRPFMLRRVKKDVANSLPPKKETRLYVGLTKMQQEWYVKVLRKDAYELNKLGGPDRVRLLNILMQLRKVCNHPYLFDGAEPGPPFSDGPHLWENSGKMMLMHKLLPKLKANDSRVLIFCQMTRVLDILEDYFRLIGFQYCRLDGSTDGALRDKQMDEFNAPGSSKFAFLLSTRAGGLGINLATADIVILYDSDWNPQVDLQAMDRAHRIGQTKPVQVFRLVTEGTVEEKIIERADRKLFLDAAVIQQGRLAEQHSSLEKDELMKMVRFGADQILSGKGGTYTDEDIDALIAKGEEKTTAMQAKLKTDAQHNLANFSLLADDEVGIDTFEFDGKNYRDADKNKGNFINLPQRERKRNYDVDEYFRETMNAGSTAGAAKSAPAEVKKRRKGPLVHDFQLFDKERLEALNDKENAMAAKWTEQNKLVSEIRSKAKQAPTFGHGAPPGQSREELLQQADEIEQRLSEFTLTSEEQAEKQKLMAEGFPDWTRKDFKAFCASLEKHGRYDFPSIVRDVVAEVGKDEKEVRKYYIAFWLHYRRIMDWKKIIERVERGERKILRLREVRDAIQEKVERHLEDTFGNFYWDAKEGENGVQDVPSAADLLQCSWSKMKINYGSGVRGRAYQEEEDAFLIYMMYRHGYGAAERIRMEIRRAWQFRFDWYFKSRNAQEIQKRCDILVKLVERENAEIRKKEEEDQTKQSAEAVVEKVSTANAVPAAAEVVNLSDETDSEQD